MASNAVKSLSRQRLSNSERLAVLRRFNTYDDRSCAIIGIALLEHALERAILRIMVPQSKDARDRLLAGSGPLATFSAKIRVARAFGIIGPKTAHAFEALNEIRNAFAHTASALSFRHHRIRNRLSGLHIMSTTRMVARAFQVYAETKTNYNTTRGHFLLIIGAFFKMFDAARAGKRPMRLKPIDQYLAL
jgi:DNA-binding MltR family transcriptional regulator